jgi:tol-pal system protein YbgF
LANQRTSRPEPEALHRSAMQASAHVAALEQRVDEERRRDGLQPFLKTWIDAAAGVRGVLAQVRTDFVRHGAAREHVDRVGRRLDDLRRRVETLALQFDVGGAPPPGRPAQPPAPVPPPAGAPPPEPSRPGAPGQPAAPGTPARPGAATPPGATVPGPGPTAGAMPPAASPPAAAAGTARQASDLYQTAYIDYTRGNYNLAIAAFKEFIRLYPGSDLAEKAQYWIGEAHFSLARDLAARGDRDRATQEFERAVQEFRRVLINYPRGDRVPTALYKEALTLIELKQPSLAEARLQFIVDQFPSTEEAAKAKEELARLKSR